MLQRSDLPELQSIRFLQHKGSPLSKFLVIAIIVILASLLLPALGRVRMKAFVVQCAGNLKQIGVASFNYSGDYEDYVVIYQSSELSLSGTIWSDINGAGYKNTVINNLLDRVIVDAWIHPYHLGYLRKSPNLLTEKLGEILRNSSTIFLFSRKILSTSKWRIFRVSKGGAFSLLEKFSGRNLNFILPQKRV